MAFMPFLGQSALAFLPSLFGGALGRRDPAERYRQMLMQLASPQNLMQTQNQLYGQYLQSPVYSQALRGAYNTGNQIQNRLGSSLAMRGLGTSGIGAIAPAVAQGLAGSLGGKLRVGAYNQAGQTAAEAIQNQLRTAMGLGPPTDYTGQLLGAGMNTFGNLLNNYFQGKQGKKGG